MYPKFVKIVDVGSRDGLQNDPGLVTAVTKVTLIHMLADCGLYIIESSAFVLPEWGPQMVSSAEVFAKIKRKLDVAYSALTPNMKGLDLAMIAGSKMSLYILRHQKPFQKHTNYTNTESIDKFSTSCDSAQKAGIAVLGYISCVLECPY
jgi:hydroxymethylglutaryl-CoA lyase